MSQTKPVPDAMGAIPYLTIKGAADAIGFYQRAFGAEVVTRLNAPDGKVVHAQLKVGPASFMMTEEMPQYQALSPSTIGDSSVSITLYVPDVDAVVAKALAAGAKPSMPLMDQFWGDRAGGVVDPFGHKWLIATHKEDLDERQLQERFRQMLEQGPSNCA
jgi:uncharacterized glyoxalase superfamily protein PhnB